MRKPDGQYAIPGEHSAISRFVDPLPIRKVPGIGKVCGTSKICLGSCELGWRARVSYQCFSQYVFMHAPMDILNLECIPLYEQICREVSFAQCFSRCDSTLLHGVITNRLWGPTGVGAGAEGPGRGGVRRPSGQARPAGCAVLTHLRRLLHGGGPSLIRLDG